MNRTTKIGVGVLAGVGVLSAGAAIVTIASDPTEGVAAIDVGNVAQVPNTPSPSASEQPATAGDAPTTTARGSDRQVVSLEQLNGVLTRGSDVDDFRIDRVEADFGPEEWILLGSADADFDGDGTVGSINDELNGLVGTEVQLLVRFDSDRDDADIYVVNDLPYRDPTGAPAPWNDPATLQTGGYGALVDAAIAAVGPDSTVIDIDSQDGLVAWEIEVVGADGVEYDVRLTADAEVVDVRRD